MQNSHHVAKVLITEQELQTRIKELADQISHDYKDKNPILVGVLKGCILFFADLIRAMDLDVETDFIAASSYGGGTESSGHVILTKDLTANCKGRHVLLVEDIVDTGITIAHLKKIFESRQMASCEIVTLLDKPSRRKVDVDVKYSAFTIPNEFIIGYGLDYEEKLRGLREICVMDTDTIGK